MTTFTREDFEMAAKAGAPAAPAHTQGWRYSASGPRSEGMYAAADRTQHWFWNPLADDGDALRLAVKLNLIVGTYDTYASVCHTMILGGESDTPDEEVVWFHSTGGDPYAATRRAIFRAAIAIGRAMP